ncbi:INO80 complex subunit C [Heterocephalus glaber]|uniref:INO80 complex subunit C n=1 Tax=Heterocephalus glaber TaxID=10181 RepID=G5C763_HETGA|nr:INO80 complex subunit C [Heterocephalus glaber]
MAAQIPIVAATSTPGIARNSKKRPASPSHNGSSGAGYGASKKKKVSSSGFAQGVSMEAMSENKMVSSEFSTGPVEKAAKPLPFKDPNFVHSGHGGAIAGKKNRTWKNLKQILAAERALPWQLNDPNYFSIDAPPSFKPAKKYSDVSGLLNARKRSKLGTEKKDLSNSSCPAGPALALCLSLFISGDVGSSMGTLFLKRSLVLV